MKYVHSGGDKSMINKTVDNSFQPYGTFYDEPVDVEKKRPDAP